MGQTSWIKTKVEGPTTFLIIWLEKKNTSYSVDEVLHFKASKERKSVEEQLS